MGDLKCREESIGSETKPSPEIQSQITRLIKTRDVLSDKLSKLSECLNPILRSQTPKDVSDEKSIGCQSPIGKELQGITMGIEDQVDFVEDLIRRLEI